MFFVHIGYPVIVQDIHEREGRNKRRYSTIQGQKQNKCQERGLNTRPPELQSVALPAELSRLAQHVTTCISIARNSDYLHRLES